MSLKNRKEVYDKLVAEGRLDRDDGALEKEFGPAKPPTPEKPAEKPPEKPVEKPKVKK